MSDAKKNQGQGQSQRPPLRLITEEGEKVKEAPKSRSQFAAMLWALSESIDRDVKNLLDP